MSGPMVPLGGQPFDARAALARGAGAADLARLRHTSESAGRDSRAELERLAQELEGVFLNQLFQAMRASVPQEGALAKSEGEALFTSMLDQSLAQEAARHMNRGLGEALYRQLARRLEGEEGAAR